MDTDVIFADTVLQVNTVVMTTSAVLCENLLKFCFCFFKVFEVDSVKFILEKFKPPYMGSFANLLFHIAQL